MEYCGVELTEEGLQHYGVKGMHWGIRRYQPYSDGSNGKFLGKKQVKKAVKTLNYNSKQYAQRKYSRDKSLLRARKYQIKGKLNKAEKERRDAGIHEDNMKDLKNEIDNTIRSLSANGYKVSESQVKTRAIDRNRQIVGQLLAGPLGQVMAMKKIDRTKYSAEKQKDTDISDSLKERGVTQYNHDKFTEDDIHKILDAIDGKSSSNGLAFDKPNSNGFQSTKVKLGNNDVNISKFNDDVDDDTANKVFKDIKTNYKKIDSDCKEAIAKDLYDEYGMGKGTHTRDQFKKAIKLNNAHIYDHGTVEFSFADYSKNDPLDGHSADVEYDMIKKKVNGISMNG